MQVVETISELRQVLRRMPRPLGLVPTMGYLHEGHLSLARQARTDNATVAASIFVNPAQFGPSEDLAAYPRDLPRDLAQLEAEGCDVVLVPSVEEVYPAGYSARVVVHGVIERLEGAARHGHFQGVATVVAKLFNMFQPDRAYFGQKDAQQCVVIKKMVTDLDFPIEIVVMPTIREAGGLAMSSRNAYLNPVEREAALVLFRALSAVEERYRAGEHDADRLRSVMRAILAGEPLAQPDYVSVADASTLVELDRVDGPAVVSLAVRIGRARLIDNVVLRV